MESPRGGDRTIENSAQSIQVGSIGDQRFLDDYVVYSAPMSYFDVVDVGVMIARTHDHVRMFVLTQ